MPPETSDHLLIVQRFIRSRQTENKMPMKDLESLPFSYGIDNTSEVIQSPCVEPHRIV